MALTERAGPPSSEDNQRPPLRICDRCEHLANCFGKHSRLRINRTANGFRHVFEDVVCDVLASNHPAPERSRLRTSFSGRVFTEIRQAPFPKIVSFCKVQPCRVNLTVEAFQQTPLHLQVVLVCALSFGFFIDVTHTVKTATNAGRTAATGAGYPRAFKTNRESSVQSHEICSKVSACSIQKSSKAAKELRF